jgi:hypothetical protein
MKLGIIGSLVWDVIHGRDPAAPPVEEWGGIAYALSSLDAHLPPGWEIVPLIKVGRDMAPEAARFLATLTRLAPGARCIEVPVANNRVVLRYESAERRCERMSGGVPGWNWGELGPMVQDLDALYLNFISGFEMCLGTAQALRRGFSGPIHADMHSLFLGMQHDGIRTLQALPNIEAWFGCFDVVQMNEEEMLQVAHDPLEVAARAMAQGVKLLVVTVGPRGAIYVENRAGNAARAENSLAAVSALSAISALVPAPQVAALDPTGCGDVFGGALTAHLLAGESTEQAIQNANAAAARNATFRGAAGLSRFLRGETVLT